MSYLRRNRPSLPYVTKQQISPEKFHLWSQTHMYCSTPESVQPNTVLIPGYGGFVPTRKAESLHAKSFANESKTALSNPRLVQNIYGLATTGLNLSTQMLVDGSKNASSSKYGKTAIQRAHPNWMGEKWISTTKETYQAPKTRLDPLFRESDAVNTKQFTKQSGFAVNRSYLDGQGWNPHPILSPIKGSSEYRDRFNPQMAFHRPVDVVKAAAIRPTERVYKFNQ